MDKISSYQKLKDKIKQLETKVEHRESELVALVRDTDFSRVTYIKMYWKTQIQIEDQIMMGDRKPIIINGFKGLMEL